LSPRDVPAEELEFRSPRLRSPRLRSPRLLKDGVDGSHEPVYCAAQY